MLATNYSYAKIEQTPSLFKHKGRQIKTDTKAFGTFPRGYKTNIMFTVFAYLKGTDLLY